MKPSIHVFFHNRCEKDGAEFEIPTDELVDGLRVVCPGCFAKGRVDIDVDGADVIWSPVEPEDAP